MAKNAKKIADLMGAKIVGQIPDVGGGAFGAMRLVEILGQRLRPSSGRRPGRPSVVEWNRRSKVPMSAETEEKLAKLAEIVSQRQKHKVSPMQVAAQLLEQAVAAANVDDL
jgi:hypothetical protein